MKYFFIAFFAAHLIGCTSGGTAVPLSPEKSEAALAPSSVALMVLGTVQDAGSPHIACTKACCANLSLASKAQRKVTALGLIDNANAKKYLFEATPNLSSQLKALVRKDISNAHEMVDGIFLTHAHIGHYTGLMYLGKEATNAQKVPVYAMPRMHEFLTQNGPWSQLVENENIALQKLEAESEVLLSKQLRVRPFLVPHRDEYSETVGYHIAGPHKSALFIPDIDKWERWEKNIVEEIKKVDYAFIDATFYSGQELNHRDISQIPHPFITESLALFKDLSPAEKSKIIFIHFNHTNPVLNANSKEAVLIKQKGFNLASLHDIYFL